MERIKRLNYYQKGILLFMAGMVLLFSVVYARTIPRVGFEYEGTILVPSQENNRTVYSGTRKGKQVRFTVSEDKTVLFQYGDKTFGPYTAKEDPAAIPKDNEMAVCMTGVELRRGDSVLFRGGVFDCGGSYLLYDIDNAGMPYVAGGEIDPAEPSVSAILTLMDNPKLTHKGEWLAWFEGVFVCVLNALSILFADELFRWNLKFQIRNADHAEPSDWEMAGRYTGWSVLAVGAFILFIMGLR